MKLPNHRYEFIQEKPIEELNSILVGRLSLYKIKEYACSKCGIVCDRLIQGKAKKSVHWDLYDQNLTVMMTQGHIIPASKGGKKHIDNLRPLCHICNHKEGSDVSWMLDDLEMFENTSRVALSRG